VRTPPVTAVVLAGGRATRFGADKLAVEVDGRPLLQRAITAVAQVADEIVVVAGFGAPEPPLRADVGVPIVVARDAITDGGPLAGLAAGLAVASHPVALLVGGDQPTLQPALLQELLRRLDAGTDTATFDVVGLEQDGQLRPLPAALRVATVLPAADVALASGTRSLIGLFDRLRVRTLAPGEWRALDPAGDSLRDVDTRTDLPSA
jgi:molybdopterin-guanine dinucleotide biosynthesis protein A